MTSSSSSSSSNSTVKATLIDFTLSRMIRPPSETETRSSRPRSKVKKSSNDVLFDPFEDDCIFQGEGDLQFDVYRGMRTIVEREGGGWEGFHPKTNLLVSSICSSYISSSSNVMARISARSGSTTS